ncbi:MAG: cytochrome C oxidase subunit IV family protein [Dehalococcoidia bacterium]
MDAFKKGYVVAVFLAVLTIAEYIFAVGLDNDQARFAGLAIAAVTKGWLIVQYFMHIARAWQPEEAH